MGILDFIKKASTPILGIDISSSNVKCVELSKAGSRYKVESYAIKAIPPGVVVEKNIADTEKLAEIIEAVVKSAKTKVKDAAVAVSGSAVITKELQLPSGQSDHQLESQIYEDADQFVPYPLEDVSLDFEVIGPVDGNDELVNVLVAACRKESVGTRSEALELAGLEPKVVDIEGYALERIYPFLSKQIDELGEQIVAIADIGGTSFTFSVMVDGTTVYHREQLFGGKGLTDEIQRRYGLSAEEAEEAKQKGGLPPDYVEEVLPPFRDAVIQQVSRSLQFFYSSSSYNYIDHIFLAGGVAAMPNLADSLEGQLGVPATVANPFLDMDMGKGIDRVTLNSHAPALLLAAGLAMRGFK